MLSDYLAKLDPVGNPLEIDQTGAVSSITTYVYDANDRLKSVCYQLACLNPSDPFIRWDYDLVGNRQTETRPTGTTTYTVNAADELTQAGSTSYSYDNNGNETAAGSRSFGYDLANRLLSTTSGSTTTSYSYDGDGNRLQASTGALASQKTNYLWDTLNPLPQLALERNGNNVALRRYTYGQGRLSMTEPATGGPVIHYYHYDQLGSVTNLTSATGTTEWTYAYDPYGTTRTETQNDPSAPTNLIKFTGEYLDPTGLYYLRARQYDPLTGRFTRLDPLDPRLNQAYISGYVYAGDRPLVMIDPAGTTLSPSDDAGLRALQASSPVIGSQPFCKPKIGPIGKLFCGVGTQRNSDDPGCSLDHGNITQFRNLAGNLEIFTWGSAHCERTDRVVAVISLTNAGRAVRKVAEAPRSILTSIEMIYRPFADVGTFAAASLRVYAEGPGGAWTGSLLWGGDPWSL